MNSKLNHIDLCSASVNMTFTVYCLLSVSMTFTLASKRCIYINIYRERKTKALRDQTMRTRVDRIQNSQVFSRRSPYVLSVNSEVLLGDCTATQARLILRYLTV